MESYRQCHVVDLIPGKLDATLSNSNSAAEWLKKAHVWLDGHDGWEEVYRLIMEHKRSK